MTRLYFKPEFTEEEIEAEFNNLEGELYKLFKKWFVIGDWSTQIIIEDDGRIGLAIRRFESLTFYERFNIEKKTEGVSLFSGIVSIDPETGESVMYVPHPETDMTITIEELRAYQLEKDPHCYDEKSEESVS
ncbi:TPA: hypothetical protein JG871_004250 [Enterobacter hormaechei subsp. xiangfangensis]|nr:hypothetical protein [Enterobacter hormaechei subsp. xiangfangensis]